MEERLYIAYGSNLNLKQMAKRCPTAKLVGVSNIKDYELVFRGGTKSAVATIERKKGNSVPVAVWKLEKEDEKMLDIYEGYPHFYKKENFKIKLNGKKIIAMAYVMTQGHQLGIPSDYYYDIIYKGYKDNGLDTEILEEALNETINKLKENQEEESHIMRWW